MVAGEAAHRDPVRVAGRGRQVGQRERLRRQQQVPALPPDDLRFGQGEAVDGDVHDQVLGGRDGERVRIEQMQAAADRVDVGRERQARERHVGFAGMQARGRGGHGKLQQAEIAHPDPPVAVVDRQQQDAETAVHVVECGQVPVFTLLGGDRAGEHQGKRHGQQPPAKGGRRSRPITPPGAEWNALRHG
ncbi:hypothetical protein [Luteimonas granuli]|uniref:Uncharacterized protein n=1 Tax=Luteimonas granuli TaxID=1176533 RepID=A0A518N6E7_9GAMM|nr:hypothetical protein [Luteimonas granuli]QDW67489.1 hypothetical protein FPZ22_11885 [Luteimonas granuli]